MKFVIIRESSPAMFNEIKDFPPLKKGHEYFNRLRLEKIKDKKYRSDVWTMKIKDINDLLHFIKVTGNYVSITINNRYNSGLPEIRIEDEPW